MPKPAAGANVDARDLKLLLTGDGPAVDVPDLALGAIGGKVGNLDYRAERLALRGVRSPAGRAAPEGAATEWAGADAVDLDFGTFRLAADRLEFPSGIHFEGPRQVRAPLARIDGLSLSIPDASALGGGRGDREDGRGDREGGRGDREGGRGDRESGGARSGPGPFRDFGFLDAIDGHINVDLFVDTTVPLLGRRRATHHFRIPIEKGTVDYRGIEDNLHWLEDAFLDIEVIDGKLVLEQDLPFVPFTGKALLWWNLDAKELELARQRRVRLRTLLSPELPPAASGRKKKSSVTFHQFALKNVDIDVSMRRETEIAIGDVARVHLGAGGRPGVAELKVGGGVQYHTRRPLEATAVRGTLHRLAAGETGLFFEPVTITASGVDLGPLRDAVVGFQGLRPGSITARLATATIRDLRVAF